MKKVICVPFAFEENMMSGTNIHSNTSNSTILTYLKNASVALISAKKHNLDSDVILVTNVDIEIIPLEIINILIKEGILIETVPFNNFRFSSEYKWGLAFYKLCVLKYLIQKNYSKICYVDTDVYIQGDFTPIWKEVDENILLYDINHGLNTKEYVEICNEFTSYYNKESIITHYGGEFFCSNLENAKIFITEAEKVYKNMQARCFESKKGDEFIVSIVAYQFKNIVKNASPYIYRFWTGVSFRLVSNCYVNNPVIILHVPAEKERGMIKIYEKYIKRGILPKKEKVWKIFRLSKVPIYDKIIKLIINFVRI